MVDFRMPALGADMDAGTLVAWRKQPGDPVKRGDIVAEVETDKGIIEVEIFTDGVIDRMLVGPGTKVPVGTPLATVREAGASIDAGRVTLPSPPPFAEPRPKPAVVLEQAPARDAPDEPPHEILYAHAYSPEAERVRVSPYRRRLAREGRAESRPPPAAPHATAESAQPTREGRVRASPRARVRAQALGIDLRTVSGTGPDGAIVERDVERAAASATPPSLVAPAPKPPADAQARMRQAIAAAMARSKREIPHYYLAQTIDLGRALEWLAAHNEGRPPTERVLPAALLLMATARAVKSVPEINGRWEGEAFVRSDAVHLGVAVSLRGGGLIAPAIHDADRLDLDALMRALSDLVARARAGRLRSSEMSEGTITVTNLGDRGVETVYPIIQPPQVAMVGFGRIVTRPWVVGDAVVPRPVVQATLAADHRVSDGHRGGLYLAALESLLADPEKP